MACAMAHGVIYQLPTSQAWVQSWTSPCGIYGGQSDPGTGFSPSLLRRSLVSIIPRVSHHYSSVTDAVWSQYLIS